MTKAEIFLIINKMDTYQLAELEEYLRVYAFPDELDPAVKDKKNEIYHQYAATVSDLVAQVEVYSHNLPRQISGLIETVFRMIAGASFEPNVKSEVAWYDSIYIQMSFLTDILYLYLIDLYIKRIEKYRKVFKSFKHQDIRTDDDRPVMEVIDEELAYLKEAYHSRLKGIRQKYEINFIELMLLLNKLPLLETMARNDFYVKTSHGDQSLKLDIIFNRAKNTVALCEINYPTIINNGYESSIGRKIWDTILVIVPLAFAVYGLIQVISERMF